jgi:hypothetical protein
LIRRHFHCLMIFSAAMPASQLVLLLIDSHYFSW